ncbi:MAG: hypothetical protein JNL72_14950 [Flavipsychrobacter sp.]|nr:hypothetical protein [Flavipsychrobacter sp.]
MPGALDVLVEIQFATDDSVLKEINQQLEKESNILRTIEERLKQLNTAASSQKNFGDQVKQVNREIEQTNSLLARMQNSYKEVDLAGASLQKQKNNWASLAAAIREAPEGTSKVKAGIFELLSILPGLTNGLGAAKKETNGMANMFVSLGKSFASSGNLAQLAVTAVTLLTDKLMEESESAKAATESNKKYADSIAQIKKQTARTLFEETADVEWLYNRARDRHLSGDDRMAAAKKMQSEWPAIFASYNALEIMEGKVDAAVRKTNEALSARAKIDGKRKELTEAQLQKDEYQERYDHALKEANEAREAKATADKTGDIGKIGTAGKNYTAKKAAYDELYTLYHPIEEKIKKLKDEIWMLQRDVSGIFEPDPMSVAGLEKELELIERKLKYLNKDGEFGDIYDQLLLQKSDVEKRIGRMEKPSPGKSNTKEDQIENAVAKTTETIAARQEQARHKNEMAAYTELANKSKRDSDDQTRTIQERHSALQMYYEWKKSEEEASSAHSIEELKKENIAAMESARKRALTEEETAEVITASRDQIYAQEEELRRKLEELDRDRIEAVKRQDEEIVQLALAQVKNLEENEERSANRQKRILKEQLEAKRITLKQYQELVAGVDKNTAQQTQQQIQEYLKEQVELLKSYGLDVTKIQQAIDTAYQKANNSINGGTSKSDKTEQKKIRDEINFTTGNIDKSLRAIGSVLDAFIEAEKTKTSVLIQEQQKRVDRAKAITKGGNAEVLKQEEDRLAALEKKQREHVHKQRQLNSLLIASQQAVNITQAVTGVLSATPGDPYSLPARVIAAVAAIIAGVASVTVALSDINSKTGYAEGGYTGDGGRYDEAGIVHKGEYVMPQDTVRRYGRETLEAIHYGRIPLDTLSGNLQSVNYRGLLQNHHNAARQNNYDLRRLEQKFDQLLEAYSNNGGTQLTINENGFVAIYDQHVKNKTRINKLR